ncbi:hypothetical protein [Flagellimonas okinawensis]|uniref:Short chain amide porin n=1 Tax=Flagellimonas okinawensis TaxID=3031324 RepID=A0ABT5XR63_9FLAO|nr:hypothetical protein [[Muricauda] okinawensis]MDF0708382.1 hypothetical protein [[Muricauda] okinawensis]
MKKILIGMAFCLLFVPKSFSQGNTEYTGGFKINFNEDGSKYLRMIAWGQFWAQYNDNVPEDVSTTNFSVRRARLLSFTQLNKKFLLLSHFGLNSLNGSNLSPVGKGESSQLFYHAFWGEWKVAENFYAGTGLHYWNGISRLNNSSTLNFMTLDNNRQSWAVLGLSDQFARHLGVYIKGRVGRLQYRVSFNEAITSTLDSSNDPTPNGRAVYRGRELLGSADAGKVIQGYFDYQFLDEESNFLPYKVGTYLGSKKVFNIGAGFLTHSNGVVVMDGAGNIEGENVNILAVDAFYDAPLGEDGSAITAYAVFQNNDYGRNFNLGPYGTGNMVYGHVGYLIPGPADKSRVQPYLSYQTRTIDAIDDNANRLGLGINLFMTGHHSKLTLEYANSKVGAGDSNGVVTLQAQIYL